MLYRPNDGTVWDTFLMKKDDTYHIFHLRFNSALGHATSKDLAHWKQEPFIEFSVPGSWHEAGATLTGAVLEFQGRYWYAVGCSTRGAGQVYGLAVSDDLYHWEMVDKDAPSIVVGGDYWPEVGFGAGGWRDTAFRVDDEGWVHCYLCANTHLADKNGSGACISHIRSKDLKTWEYLPPAAEVGQWVSAAECPSIFELNGKWYLTFVDHGSGGMRWHTPGVEDTGGTYYLMADHPDGPYTLPKNPLLLGSGLDRQESWAGRVAMIDGKPIIYSHMSSKTAVANLKEVIQLPDGELAVKNLHNMDLLAVEAPRKIDFFTQLEVRGGTDYGDWSAEAGVLTGDCPAWGSVVQISPEEKDFILNADVTLNDGAALGFALRSHIYEGVARFAGFPAPKEHGAAAIRLDYELGRAEIEELTLAGRSGYGHSDFMNSTLVRNPDRRGLTLERGRQYHVCIIARDVYYEVYLDDILVLCKQLGTTTAGGVELFVERGSASFANVTLTAIEPLANA